MIMIGKWAFFALLIGMGAFAWLVGYLGGRQIKQERMEALHLAMKMVESGKLNPDGDGRIEIVTMLEQPENKERDE